MCFRWGLARHRYCHAVPRKNDSNVKSFMNLYPAASSMLEYFGTPTQAHNNPFSPTLLQPKAEASLPFELLTDYLRRLRVGFSSSKVVAVFSDAIVAPLVLILSKMDLTFIFVAMKVVFLPAEELQRSCAKCISKVCGFSSWFRNFLNTSNCKAEFVLQPFLPSRIFLMGILCSIIASILVNFFVLKVGANQFFGSGQSSLRWTIYEDSVGSMTISSMGLSGRSWRILHMALVQESKIKSCIHPAGTRNLAAA